MDELALLVMPDAEREVVIEVPDDEVGKVTMHNILPRLSATPGVLRHPAPTLGQHSEEILARIGVTHDAFNELRLKKVV